MSTQEFKELSELITDLRIDIAKLNEKIDAIKVTTNKIDAIDKMANEANNSVKSAHHRIDRIEKMIYWLATTVAGSLITAIITMLVKGGFLS